MRRKHLLLSLLLLLVGAVSASAQTWTPSERVNTFDASKWYLIYDASASQGNRFSVENGASNMGGTVVNPNAFTTYTSKHLFRVLPQADGTYFFQAYNGKYISGVSANAEAGAAYEMGTYLATAADCGQNALDNGTTINKENITAEHNFFYVKKPDEKSYWNGNPAYFNTWEDAHPYAFFEVPEDVINKIQFYSLKVAIAEYNAVFASAVGSDDPGYYSASNLAIANGAIADAQAVIDANGDEAACEAALATLDEVVGPIAPNPITTGIYKIVCAYPGYMSKQGVEKAIYASAAGTYAWATVDDGSKPFYWNVNVDGSGSVTIQNAAYETWMNGMATLGETASVVKCTLLGDGQFNLDCGGVFHTGGHSNGAGVSGWITGYGGGNLNTGDAWKLVRVEEIPESAIKAWDFIVAKASTEYVALTEVISGKVQDWATTYRGLTGLITNASQLYSAYDQNLCGGADGGGVATLIDNDNSTYLHTAYGGTIPAGFHNLEVTFDVAVGDFMFYIYARNTGYSNNRPKKVSVYGSKDGGTNYTKIKTIDYDLSLPNNGTQLQSLWGVIEGGEYTKFRFDVEATNTGTNFFTMAEFQMYAVPEEGEAKTVAENLNAYFSIANMDDVNILANKFIYTDVAAAEALAEANVVIAKTGVGYPKADDAARTALAAAIDLDPATPGYNKTIILALDAYKASTNVVFPENGKAYKLYAQYMNNDPQPLYFNGTRIAAKDEGNIEDANSMIFVCRLLDNGQYVFVNNAGKYLVWCDDQNDTKSVSVNGYTDAYEEKNQWIVNQPSSVGMVGEQYFGTFFLAGYGKDGNGYYLTPRRKGADEDCAFVSSGAYAWHYDAEGRTPLFSFEEVTYANTPEFQAAAGLEDITALATFSAPFATVIPEGVTAYYAKAQGENYVALEAIEADAIPANEGVILTGAAGKVTMLPATTEAAAEITDNKFANTAGATADLTTSDYILTNATPAGEAAAVTGFFKLTEAGSLAMNKAYLAGGVASAVKLLFGGNATGIEGVEAADADNAPVYDLSGRKVASPVKGGVYIKNGKKYIVK